MHARARAMRAVPALAAALRLGDRPSRDAHGAGIAMTPLPDARARARRRRARSSSPRAAAGVASTGGLHVDRPLHAARPRRAATWLDTWFTMWSSEHDRDTPASLRCASMHLGDPFDFIVIGAGTAGCLLANRLSRRSAPARAADRGRRARRLSLDPHPGRLPVLHRQPAHRLALQDRARRRASTAACCAIRAARCWAARSSINGMIYMRGQARDYDGWARAHRRPGLALGRTACPTSCATRTTGAATRRRRRCTPARATTPPARAQRRRMARREAAAALAHPRRVRRRPRCRPASRAPTTSTAATTKASATSRSTSAAACAGTRPRPSCGRRCSAAEPAGADRRARHARAGRRDRRPDGELRCARRRAAHRHATRRCRCAAAARCCCRPARSARRRSCSSRASATARAADGARHRRRATSCPASAATCRTTCRSARCSRSTARARSTRCRPSLVRQGAHRGRIRAHAQRADEHGAVAAGRLHALRSGAGRWANLEYHVQPLSLDAFGEPLHAFEAFTASVCNLNPTSRAARCTSSRPTRRRRRRSRRDYLATEGDRRVAADSLRLTRRIVGAAGAGAVPAARGQARRCSSRPTTNSRAWPATSARRSSIRSAPAAWAATTSPTAVLDSRLRVRGVAGLRVVDASVMPDHHQRQHQLADADDRRARRRMDAGGVARKSHDLNGG